MDSSVTPSDSEVHMQSKMTLRAPDLVFSHLFHELRKGRLHTKIEQRRSLREEGGG